MNLYVSREIAGSNVFGGIGTHVYHALSTGENYAITSKISYDQIENTESICGKFHSEGFKGKGTQHPILNLFLMFYYRVSLLLFILQLARQRSKERISVEAPEYMFELIFLVLVPRILRRNIHITTRLHGSSAYDRSSNSISTKDFQSWIFWKLEKLQAERSDLIVAPTEFAKTVYEQHFRKKIEIVENAFHVRDIEQHVSEDICITYIGSNDPHKGIDVLDALVKAFPNLQFEAYGNLSRHADNIIVNHITLSELPQMLRARRRVLIVPSVSETYGYTFLEGVHYAEYVLASKITVFEELSAKYRPTNVKLIDPSKPEKWIGAVREYIG